MMDLRIWKRRSRSGYHDYHCDPCFEARGLDKEVSGYCKDCCQYLCEHCHVTHNKLQVTRGHVIIEGEEMPEQPKPAKRRKLDFCGKHPELIRDMFCLTHNEELCTLCGFKEHQKCTVRSFEELSTTDLKTFYESMNELKETLGSAKAFIESSVDKLKVDKKAIQEKARQCHDTIVNLAAYYLNNTEKKIQGVFERQVNFQTKYIFQIEHLMSNLEKEISEVRELIGKPLNKKEILKLQSIVKFASKCAYDFENLHEKNLTYEFSYFTKNKPIDKFISTGYTSLGSAFMVLGPSPKVPVPNISFMASSSNTNSIVTSGPKQRKRTVEDLRKTRPKNTTPTQTSVSKQPKSKLEELSDLIAFRQQESSSVTEFGYQAASAGPSNLRKPSTTGATVSSLAHRSVKSILTETVFGYSCT